MARVSKRLFRNLKPLLPTGPNPESTAVPRSKYRNRKTIVNGLSFDSGREAKRWLELRALLDAGDISGLRRQVSFRLRVQGMVVARYRADFVYVERGALVVEDAKGFRTEAYKLKKRLMKACFGIEIRET